MGPALRAYCDGLLARYRTLSARERTLVAVTLLAATWGLWAVTLGDRQSAATRALEVSVVELEDRLAGARSELDQLESGAVTDPNERLRRERDRLDGKLRQMDASLGTLLDRFVAPERMPFLLEDVLLRHAGLTLVKIESLPAEPMDVSALAEASDHTAEPGSAAVPADEGAPLRIYRHPLRVELKGGYFDVMAYLAQLEAGAWRFGWRRLDYQVADYPLATVTVEIETLSRERSWIGV